VFDIIYNYVFIESSALNFNFFCENTPYEPIGLTYVADPVNITTQSTGMGT
jgi:hypothetical protein